jgi:hypothetical protein
VRRSDLLAVGLLLALSAVFNADVLLGQTLIGMDTATAFYPWYAFLGEQLRSGHLPTWNPHQFSGAPFAADPESGWMYLPAMLAFTLLPLDAAARAHMSLHVVLAGVSAYGLARTLGANLGGALVAGTVYAQTGFFVGHSVCCFAYSSVAAWLPLMLLGAELAIRAGRWRERAMWWGLSGLAFSQILAVWVGQAAYYATLLLSSYIASRTLVGSAGIRQRLLSTAAHLIGVFTFGFGLAAAGLLPRLEYNALSNLPGGYPDAGAVLPAATWTDWGFLSNWNQLLLVPGFHYIGWSALGLAVLAVPFAARRRTPTHALIYFAALPVLVLVLARYEPTPLHSLLSLLPGFDRIHARSPERAMTVFYLGPALLAAFAVTRMRFHNRPRLTTSLGLLGVAVVWLDLHTAWAVQLAQSQSAVGAHQLEHAELAAYYAPRGAARFLLTRAENERFRYFGHAQHILGEPIPYTLRWDNPRVSALEVNNRASISGLHDVQGYNPIHLARYDEFMAALNGTPQNYHHADVLHTGLDSPLLDLLNARYVIVPRVNAPDEIAARFRGDLRVVYEDHQVRVLERPHVLARAWIVHHAQQVPTGRAANILASGVVDPSRTVLLEEPPPELETPIEPLDDDVRVVRYAADAIQLRTSSSAAGLVVLSEVYYPAWQAYVDGQPTRVYVADHALRAVALTAGEHVVDLRYESAALSVGLVISLALSTLLAALVILVRATT